MASGSPATQALIAQVTTAAAPTAKPPRATTAAGTSRPAA
jgi:hypothetical protein